ncbi:MAG: tetratricopeptide repeat protein [Verrucomicrobiota bacterium]|nr:tetratricopeptide repeat protein [Verrucomicrobiota bacterium]
MNRAEKYFEAGEYEKAKIEYLNVLRLDQLNIKAFQRMGAIWSAQGAPLRAGPFLVRARELAPDDTDNRLKLARVFLAVSAFAETRKETLTVLEQSPSNGEAILLLSEASRTADEVAAFEQQLQKFPDRNTVAFHLAGATLALRKTDLPAAEEALGKAVSADPKSSLAHSALATLHLFKKDRAKASEELKNAAELAPLRSNERVQYADFQAQTGARTEAAASLQALTSEAPDFLPAWRLLAQIAFDEKKFDEALVLLDNVFRQDPDNPDSRMLEAQVRLSKGEGAKAVEGLERLDKAYPDAPALKFQLARAHLLNNNPGAAAAVLNEALAKNPDFVDATLLLAEVNLRSGNAPAAIEALEGLLKKQPRQPQAELSLAEAYRVTGRLDDAVAVFRNQIGLAPNNVQAHLSLGLLLRQQKNLPEARAEFVKALELAPENVFAEDQLVELDIGAKAFEAATERVNGLVKRLPDSAPAYVSAGKVYVAQKLWDEAEASFSKALQLDPNLAPAYDLLLATYIAANKLPAAVAQLEALLQKTPDNPAALMILALIHDQMADYAKSRDAYEKLLGLKPDFVAALNNLAYLYSERLNQLDRAADLARKARTLQPTDPSIMDTFGWVLFKQGDYHQALGLLQESAAKLPNLPEIQYHLGMASYMMGQTDVARAAFRKAAESPKDFPGKDEVQRRLALLGDSSTAPQDLATGDLEALLKQQPHDPVALVRLAEAYEKEGEIAKSASAYESAIKINPKLVSATVKLAQFNAGPLQNKEKALEYARKAREMAPSDIQITAILGSLAYEAGNFTWAYSLLQESSRQTPETPSLLRNYAWAAYALGKLNEAQQAMQKVVALLPDSSEGADAKSFLAMTALEAAAEKTSVDQAQVQALLQKDPDYVPALMLQAAGQLQAGAGKAAEETYVRVLQRFPDFAPAQKQLALIYSEDPANVAKAYDLAMKARKTMAEDPELARTLGVVSYHKKEYSQAIQALNQGARKNPLDAKGLYYLGMSHLKTRQPERAREELAKAIEMGLAEPLAAEARLALEDLSKQ